MDESKSNKWLCGLVGCATLATELTLYRVFDYVYTPELAFFIVTSALAGLALAGFFSWQLSEKNQDCRPLLLNVVGVILTFLPDILNLLRPLSGEPSVFVALICITLIGAIFGQLAFVLLQTFKIKTGLFVRLYSIDLMGAVAGCFVWLFLLAEVGPERILIGIGVTLCLSSALVARTKGWIGPVISVLVLVICTIGTDKLWPHINKRDVFNYRKKAVLEKQIWDPVSTLEVFRWPENPGHRDVLFDGGQLRTTLFQFNGDFASYKNAIISGQNPGSWSREVALAHALKDGQSPRTLIISGGGGQELFAALSFGAKQATVVDITPSLKQLTHRDYAGYIGNVFLRPEVHFIGQDARTFLRFDKNKYDIIQMYSAHTSSTGSSFATQTSVLLTVESFKDYFSHLTDNGILQVNHAVMARLARTAKRAWAQLSDSNFKSHILIFDRVPTVDDLGTFLFKKTPWTAVEVEKIKNYLAVDSAQQFIWLWDGESEIGLLPPSTLAQNESQEELAQLRFNTDPPTDLHPYFKFVARSSSPQSNAAGYITPTIKQLLPNQTWWSLPQVTQLAGLIVILGCLLGGASTLLKTKTRSGHFFVIGSGFAALQFFYIYVGSRVGGNPAYNLAAVISGLLLGSSLAAQLELQFDRHIASRWFKLTSLFLLSTIPLFFYSPPPRAVLGQPIGGSVVTFLVMVVLGLLIGHYFPRSVRKYSLSSQGIALSWLSWGAGTLFASGLALILSLYWGFHWVYLFAMGCYLILAYRGPD